MSIAATPTRPVYRLTFPRVVAGEWTKFWSLRSTWVTTALSMLVLTGIGLIAAASYDPADTGPRPGGASGTMDVMSLAVSGTTFAALAVGVLGVLLSAGEYTTGMVRSTLVAVPTRLPVLGAKSLIAGGTAFVTMTVAAFAAFLAGSPLLSSQMTALGLGDDGVLRSLLGAGLYLGLVAVLGVGLGTLVRSTAGGIAILAGALLVVPGLIRLLPDSRSDAVGPYLPSTAGTAIESLTRADGSFGPWTGLAVFAGYVVVVLVAAAYRLTSTDA
jgi:ABC-2 type transport system permease protein